MRKIIRLIIEWGITLFVVCLFIEAIFFTPLEIWAWGVTNKKLEMTWLIAITVITLKMYFKEVFKNEKDTRSNS